MIGTFLGYDDNKGTIKGDDGKRYFFDKNDTDYKSNDKIDFEIDGEDGATSIFVVTSTPIQSETVTSNDTQTEPVSNGLKWKWYDWVLTLLTYGLWAIVYFLRKKGFSTMKSVGIVVGGVLILAVIAGIFGDKASRDTDVAVADGTEVEAPAPECNLVMQKRMIYKILQINWKVFILKLNIQFLHTNLRMKVLSIL